MATGSEVTTALIPGRTIEEHRSDRYRLKMPSTRLILVRHGESVVQVEGIVGGPKACRGLSERGRRQVSALRDRWLRSGFRADVLLSSTLPRAVETAELLSDALGGLVPEL